jgi:hypothetical protein
LGAERVVLPCVNLERSGVAGFLVLVSEFLVAVLAADLLLEADATDINFCV